MDDRAPWEIDYCIRLKFACSYLDMMDLTGVKRAFVSNAYGVNGELDKWCIERINIVLDKCAALVTEHGPLSMSALIVAQGYAARLHQAGLFGNAQIPTAGTTKTEAAHAAER